MTNRRSFLKKSASIGPLALGSTSLYPLEKEPDNPMRILVTGGHPDDPETGAGGTIRSFTREGHHVTILYMTTGEAGIPGTSYQDAAHIRHKEASLACKILGAEPLFAGQIDGSSFVNNDWYEKILSTVQQVDPDAIFTHWPVDTHRDHRHCSMMTFDAWNRSQRKAAFYYYEVVSGYQTMSFRPTHYVDITPVAEEKWESCFVHKSQKIKESYHEDHAKMEDFRGRENNCQYAEAFVHLDASPQIMLPV